MKRYLGLFVALLSLFSLTIAVATPAAAAADPSIVRTVNGLVKGIITSTTRQFLGIPYAAPPVGTLRWKAPPPGRKYVMRPTLAVSVLRWVRP